MPIYEYQCESCQHRFEALQKISDEALTECPECSLHQLKKLVSAASFRLKGGGWYETDFKTGDKKQLAQSESSETGSGKSSESTREEKAASSKGDGDAKSTAKKVEKDTTTKSAASTDSSSSSKEH